MAEPEGNHFLDGNAVTFDLMRYRSLGDAFLDRVAAHPERTALTIFRGSTAANHDSLTFAELAQRAQSRAESLAARLPAGERVLIALPTGTEFVEVYLACLLAGVVAVPASTPGRGSAAERTAAIAGDCAPSLAVTTDGDRSALAEELTRRGHGHVPVVGASQDELAATPSGPVRRRQPGRDTLAVLQYSSGSTGAPRGVMLAHGNILTNMAAYHEFAGPGPDDVLGSWMPLHHDFGLFAQTTFGLLYGAPVVLMPPYDFVRRPVEWLRMLDRYVCSASAAPNFAFDLCLRLIPDEQLDGLDLSAVRILINGSEPIHPPTMAAFAQRLARIGLRPEALTAGYGMAEATIYVSGTAREQQPTVLVADPVRLADGKNPALVKTAYGEGKEAMGVGVPSAFEARIVDPQTRRVAPDDSIGELWLRGGSVGLGYWNKPQASAQIFHARLAGADGHDETGPGWLRTGDLGAFIGGELFITGRIKETLIVRGRNLFPHDLEREARTAHDALHNFVGAAFGVSAPDERIVLVHEVAPRTPVEHLPAVATAVMRNLTDSFGVPVYNILLVRRGTVRRTTSGKIRRMAMREWFLAGEIPVLHADLEPAVRRLAAGGAR
ncbi:fatty acyl-AMP ligase [Frankia sp. Cas3]|uniref:fatty acyl-AMP ligase n=1 Tax=Frankia sp. Cas3 TaxID=3073926 RepID=UPI002AD54B2C|nr:fatty acyl-AMP ligase [Frankia sp. Cas3]